MVVLSFILYPFVVLFVYYKLGLHKSKDNFEKYFPLGAAGALWIAAPVLIAISIPVLTLLGIAKGVEHVKEKKWKTQ